METTIYFFGLVLVLAEPISKCLPLFVVIENMVGFDIITGCLSFNFLLSKIGACFLTSFLLKGIKLSGGGTAAVGDCLTVVVPDFMGGSPS